MAHSATDANHLAYQYGTTERLKIRQETHRLYSERQDNFFDWMLAQVGLRSGQVIADIGCGPGAYFPHLDSGDLTVIGVDMSPAMLAAATGQVLKPTIRLHVARGDAQHLPLADNSCDRAMANHLLYHLPDQRAALKELKRIVKPGGRILLGANAAHARGTLEAIHRDVANAFGYRVGSGVDSLFNLNHLERVREILPTAQVRIRGDAFLFPSVEPALRYYASGLIDLVEPFPDDRHHRAQLLPAVAARLEAILAEQGRLRMPKDSGCFIATV